MADWTWEADAAGRFTVAEQAREFGIDPARPLDLDRLTRHDNEDEIARRRALLNRRLPFRDLLWRYDWEGFTLEFMLSGVPVHAAEGVFCGYRGGARDVTSTSELSRRAAGPRQSGAGVSALPLAAVPDALADGPAAAETAWRRLDILVVEDDAVNRLVIRGFLSRHGHTVVFAHDGERGVAAVQAQSFDVVLMDVMMPGIDGPTATRMIRALPPPACEVPIIALTANAMRGDRERYLADGMNDYVTKPIDRATLFAAIERVVGERAFRVVVKAGPEAGAPDAPGPDARVPNAEHAAILDALADELDL